MVGEVRAAGTPVLTHIFDDDKLAKVLRLKVRNNKELARDAAIYHAGLKKAADKLAREKAAYEKRKAGK